MIYKQQTSPISIASVCVLAILSFGCSSTGKANPVQPVTARTESEASVESLIQKVDAIQHYHQIILRESIAPDDLEIGPDETRQFDDEFDRSLELMHQDVDHTLDYLRNYISHHRRLGPIDP